MQVKRYEVTGINEAMEKIKRDLGPDAIILSSRRIKGEGREKMEVVAAIDTTEKKEDRSGKDVTAWPPQAALKDQDDSPPLVVEPDAARLKRMESDLKALRQNFVRLFDHFGIEVSSAYCGPLASIYEGMLMRGLSKECALKLLNTLKESLPQGSYIDDRGMWRSLQHFMAQSMAPFFTPEAKGRKMRAFVGPTGEGKTTTLAKLAARALYGEKKKVGIITMDTYRIGAVAQLEIYADIMNVPLETVTDRKELRRAMKRLADKDVVLIDTPGRSRKDTEHLVKMRELLTGDFPVDITLVISATASSETMARAADRFDITGYDRIIFTKLDDASGCGRIYNVVDRLRKPVSHVADGQRVPQDIEEMDPRKLARLIVEERMPVH